MVDKAKLMGRIIAAGYNQKTLAKAMNKSKNSINSKINSKIPFDTDEVLEICALCDITNGVEKADIFLASPSQ